MPWALIAMHIQRRKLVTYTVVQLSILQQTDISRLLLKIKIFLNSGHERVNLFTKRFRIALG